jgi:hypothetical protein
LVNNNTTPGNYEIKWTAHNKPSRTYLIKMESENFTDVKRITLQNNEGNNSSFLGVFV